MSKKFQNVLEKIGADVLTDDIKKALTEAFDAAVQEKIDSVVALEVDAACKKLDENHASKLTELLEAIDADHVNKFKKVLIKVESDYTDKLEKVIEHYEQTIQKEAEEFRDKIVSEMSNFIDLKLESLVPKEQLEEAVDNIRSKKLVESIKRIVSVDEDYITDNIREALMDGKEQINALRTELHEAVKANIEINQKFKKTSAEKMLIEKTASFNDAKRDYIIKVLGEKSPEEIEENFDYVVEMFERDDEAKADIIKESAVSKAKTRVVEVPKAEPQQIVSESKSVGTASGVDAYLAELKAL